MTPLLVDRAHTDSCIVNGCNLVQPRIKTKGMTKYRKGPQRSITQDHRGSAIMRKLPDLQQVGTWSTTTSQFLPSIWILDGAGRSNCHQ